MLNSTTGIRLYSKTIRQLALIMLLSGLSLIAAAKGDSLLVNKLEGEMYRYFNTNEKDQFFSIVKQLKDECLKAGDERRFYKAWANQSIYAFKRISPEEGMRTAREAREYARIHDSKFGLYTATYVIGSNLLAMEQLDNAETYLLEALEYQKQYFPHESAAAPYLELSRVEQKRHHFEKAIMYADLALAEPDVITQHKILAWTNKCLALAYIKGGSRNEFNKAYEERLRLLKQSGQLDNQDKRLIICHAMMNEHYEEALRRTLPEQENAVRQELLAQIYSRMGRYKEAYEAQVRFKELSDSVKDNVLGKQIHQYATELGLVKAENESKDLRIANAQQSVRMRMVTLTALASIVLIIIVTLLLLYWRHHNQLKALHTMNMQLEDTKQAEHEARKSAEQALQVKRNFLNSISHELRTPLNAIYGFSQILTTPGLDLDDEQKSDYSQRIATSTKLLTDIVDNMIEISHYDSLTCVACDDMVKVDLLCQDMLWEYMSKTAPDVELKLRTNLVDTFIVRTNDQCLRKVFRNLLDNAVKFTQHGTITITATDTEPVGRLTFSITDTGPGIPPEKQKAVFDLFTETDEQIKTTGMGLSISRSICRLLGGSIHVDPDYTDGCRMVFDISAY
jgi:signal transduction histidine kinase